MIQVLIHDCQEMKDKTRNVGATVVTLIELIWAQARTTVQRELIDLTQALRWGKGKVTTTYTDCYYAFMIYGERGLLTAGKTEH